MYPDSDEPSKRRPKQAINVKNDHVKRRPPKRITLAKNGRYAHISAQDIADWTGVALRTARSYRADPDRMPPHIREIVELKALGIVSGLPGVAIVDGHLIVPGGLTFTPEQLSALTYVYQERDELRRLVKRHEEKIRQLDAALDRALDRAGEPVAVNDSE